MLKMRLPSYKRDLNADKKAKEKAAAEAAARNKQAEQEKAMTLKPEGNKIVKLTNLRNVPHGKKRAEKKTSRSSSVRGTLVLFVIALVAYFIYNAFANRDEENGEESVFLLSRKNHKNSFVF